MSEDNKNNFWPSYVDIMTTLFAIMLVLFAVSYSRFKVKERELTVLADHFIEIMDIYDAVSNIDSTKFEYNSQYSKNIFKLTIKYKTKGFNLDYDLDVASEDSANNLRKEIYNAGQSIKNTILNMQKRDNLKKDIKYLVVVEGQSSKIPYHENEWMNNNTLSYLRSQYLVEYWKNRGLDFSQLDRCEIVICGSGEGGVPRHDPDTTKLGSLVNVHIMNSKSCNHFKEVLYDNDVYSQYDALINIKTTHEKEYWPLWTLAEERNQRFLIHIVPVIGQLTMDDKIKELIEKYRKSE